MANTDAPRGFTPVGTMSGSPWGGTVRAYQTAASDIFIGDMCTLDTAGNVAAAASASVHLVGVCVGFLKAQSTNETTGIMSNDLTNNNIDLGRTWFDTSADGGSVWALVTTGPDVLYEVQSDGTIAITDVGLNADITTTTGDTLTGRSKHELSATVTTDTTAHMRIVGIAQRIDNDVATDNSKWITRINENHYTSRLGV